MAMRKFVVGVAGLALLFCVGCGSVQKSSNVQKGGMIGGGTGGVLGASIGHASSAGGLPGFLVGASVGTATGALVADYYYPDHPQETAESGEELAEMNSQLAAREAQVHELRQALQEEEEQRQALIEAHEQARTELDQLQARIGEDGGVEEEAGGALKVTILSDVLFKSGKNALTKEGQEVLSRTARNIRKQFPDAALEIRGHTDNVPIRYSKWSSNWELSCARAVSVLHHLIESEGFQPNRLRAVGLADTRPVDTNASAGGRKKNRRAEIVIYPNSQVAAREIELD